MDKLIGLFVDQVLANKRADPLFIFLAGAIALWALTGGASNLFDGATVRKLEAKAKTHAKAISECKTLTKQAKAELAAKEGEFSQLMIDHRILQNQNEMLKLMVYGPNGGTRPLPPSTDQDPESEE